MPANMKEMINSVGKVKNAITILVKIRAMARVFVPLTPMSIGKVITVSSFISRISKGKTKAEIKKKLTQKIPASKFGRISHELINAQVMPT